MGGSGGGSKKWADRFRVGQGWDRHRLAPRPPRGEGRELLIGGERFDSELGPVAHSDGDALLHALIDALLGASALGDVGTHFPDSDPRWAGADSMGLLAAALERVREAGWAVVNVDCTVLLERPRLGEKRDAIRERLAAALGVDPSRVGLKAKSGEGVGPVGRREAIEAQAVALLHRIEK